MRPTLIFCGNTLISSFDYVPHSPLEGSPFSSLQLESNPTPSRQPSLGAAALGPCHPTPLRSLPGVCHTWEMRSHLPPPAHASLGASNPAFPKLILLYSVPSRHLLNCCFSGLLVSPNQPREQLEFLSTWHRPSHLPMFTWPGNVSSAASAPLRALLSTSPQHPFTFKIFAAFTDFCSSLKSKAHTLKNTKNIPTYSLKVKWWIYVTTAR